MSERIYNNYLQTFIVKLSPAFEMEKHVIDHGLWEMPSVWIFEQCIKPGFVCVDVGANCGLLSLAMAKYAGRAGRVFCFEPSSVTYPRLVDNINLNSEWRGTIVPEKVGIGEKDGYSILAPQSGGNAQVKAEYHDSLDFDGELCIVTTLDKVLANHSRVDFIKIDVEGMELEVLKGGIVTLRTHYPIIWYESELEHGWFDKEKVKACETLLRAEGYELFKTCPDRRLVPVTFPNYEVNSLAVHKNKRDAIADLLA